MTTTKTVPLRKRTENEATHYMQGRISGLRDIHTMALDHAKRVEALVDAAKMALKVLRECPAAELPAPDDRRLCEHCKGDGVVHDHDDAAQTRRCPTCRGSGVQPTAQDDT